MLAYLRFFLSRFGVDLNAAAAFPCGRQDDDTQDIGREAHGGSEHGADSGQVCLPRHGAHLIRRPLLPRRRGRPILSLSRDEFCRMIVQWILNLCQWVQWRRDVAFAGYQVNIQMDISAEKMIFGVAGVDPKRREELIKASSLLFQSVHLWNE
jgi:hypothetical protein